MKNSRYVYTTFEEAMVDKAIEDLLNGKTDSVDLRELSKTLNPFKVDEILSTFEYERGDWDQNGWQGDNWIYYTKEGSPTLVLYFEAWDFDLKLMLEE